ncbi:FKBP-type peptidyl-prolyl cis-trans isomerase [Serratia marcescens]|nr:FKBP-type peptidyl-prolyl cis-trans isomerase [Serratia marcescens]
MDNRRLLKTLKEQQVLLGRQADTIAQQKSQLTTQAGEAVSLQARLAEARQQHERDIAAQTALQTSLADLKARAADGAPSIALKTLRLNNDTLTAQLQATAAQLRDVQARLDDRRQQHQTDVEKQLASVTSVRDAQVTSITRLQAQLRDAGDKLQKTQQALQQATSELSAKTEAEKQLQTSLASLTATQTEQTKTVQGYAAKLADAQQQRDEAQQQQQAAVQREAALKSELTALQARPVLDTDAAKQAYAAGVSMAQDALALLKTRATQGLVMDRSTVLSGMRDAFSGKMALDATSRNKALYDTAVAVNALLTRQKQAARTQGERYQARFARLKGVTHDADGIYRRVNYAGTGHLTLNDTVSVVVKESLPDGTVTSDMDVSGKVLTLPLKQYPPLFQEGLRTLGAHGSVTLVVPPEKAYGDRGVPPTIPPGATMIYDIRIVDVQPASDTASPVSSDTKKKTP